MDDESQVVRVQELGIPLTSAGLGSRRVAGLEGLKVGGFVSPGRWQSHGHRGALGRNL